MFGSTSQIMKAGKMSITLKKVKKAIPNGTAVPTGSKGAWVEDMMEESLDIPVNRGKGSDLPSGIDLKSRKEGAQSGMSLGSMTTKDIVGTPWESCPLREKNKQLIITKWDPDTGEVTKTEQIDLSSVACQQSLRDAYEAARSAIANGEDTYTSDTGDVYFEKKKGNSWQLRISESRLKKLKSKAWSQPVLNDKELFPDD